MHTRENGRLIIVHVVARLRVFLLYRSQIVLIASLSSDVDSLPVDAILAG